MTEHLIASPTTETVRGAFAGHLIGTEPPKSFLAAMLDLQAAHLAYRAIGYERDDNEAFWRVSDAGKALGAMMRRHGVDPGIVSEWLV